MVSNSGDIVRYYQVKTGPEVSAGPIELIFHQWPPTLHRTHKFEFSKWILPVRSSGQFRELGTLLSRELPGFRTVILVVLVGP